MTVLGIERTAALVAAMGFLAIAVFQLALALGAPLAGRPGAARSRGFPSGHGCRR